jgi:hypothetical protein
MGETPSRQGRDRILLFGRERLIGARDERGMIEAERVADQHPSIEFR